MRKGARDGSLNLHIRLATKEDLDALLNLENICFKEETFQKRQLKYLLLKARSMVLVAEIDRNIIGSMIILLRKNILNARIYSFNVHPEHRRKGIGSSLMDTALDKLEKKGYKNITLEVGINNQIAWNLYRSKGFIVDKKLSNYYTNGDDALHLIKKLG
ncbi:MAG: N-acetyltransferase [Candidatus Methanoperedens sp.]|nr:N-acetyltransferase [Candidatus Methanoperedens sp.]CAG0973874.1 diamine N-acetyltransferase [Methanosarcinales archaeon]